MAQSEARYWYFGGFAGLDFSTNIPNPLSNSSMSVAEGCASISDANGNLLFYTDGATVWDQTHGVMANGNGLAGSGSPSQGVYIVKQPGNANVYFVFTMTGSPITGSNLYYSVINMGLASGIGSVTVKNASLFTNPGSPTEKLTGTTHCNGIDEWIVACAGGAQYNAYLLTSIGLNTTPIVSVIGNTLNSSGSIKISPNGSKIAVTRNGGANAICELFDFNNSTGILTNSLALSGVGNGLVSCEFSQDGTKFYAGRIGPSVGTEIFQWNLCAGSNTAIVASLYTVTSTGSWKSSMQLAPNGKIYCAKVGYSNLGVINNPNLQGPLCNYIENGQSLGTGTCNYGLPNFNNSSFLKLPQIPNFTYTLSNVICNTILFNAPPFAQTLPGILCQGSGISLMAINWDFGDPISGPANTSTLANPTHFYGANGTYLVKLILNYGCGNVDTLKQFVLVNQSCLTITSSSITCASLGSATVGNILGSGVYSYTWLPLGQNNAVAMNLAPGSYTLFVQDVSNNITFSSSVVFAPLVPLTGSLSATNSFVCNGASNGTATLHSLAGGSGNQYYNWTNGSSSYTTSSVSNLTAGLWSVTVTDALTACQVHSVFTIGQPPALSLQIAASSVSSCAGTSITFTATNSGGTPGAGPAYTYTWMGGSSTDTHTVSQALAGNYVYTVHSSDANACLVSQTIAVDFVPNPTLSVSNVSVCPLEVGTLTVSGAASYTWQTSTPLSLTTPVFTDSPVSSAQYTVIGEALSCTAMAMASIIVKPSPNPTILHNAPLCEGQTLQLNTLAYSAFIWQGPNSFVSFAGTNTLNNVQQLQAGLYQLTVTAANNCTAATSASIEVKPLPQFSITASSSSICLNTTSSTLSISSSIAATNYSWFPNQGLSSNTGSVVDASPTSNKTYTVIGALNGCTNSAQSSVMVVPPPSLTAQLSSNTLCSQAFNGSPNTITLTAGGASTYTLQTFPDMSNNNPGGPVSQLTSIPPYTGIGSATLSGSNGVCTVSLTTTFSILPNPTVSINNYSPVICAGDTYTYTNQGANSYTWSAATPNFTTYSNGGVAVAHPSINSVFSVFGGSLGCNSALQTSSITVNPLPEVTVSPNPAKVCVGSTVALEALGNGSQFYWIPGFGLNSFSSQSVVAYIQQNQSYTVIAALNNCSNTAVGLVSVMPLPLPEIIAIKDELCLYEEIQLKGEGGVYYEWRTPVFQTYSVQTLQLGASHLNLNGLYTLKVVDENACVAYSTHWVTVHDLPKGYLLPEQKEFCVPYCNTIEFKANPTNQNITAGNWTVDGKLYSSDSFKPCFAEAKTYTVFGGISNEFNCKNTVALYLIGRPKPKAAFYVTPENPVEGLDEVSFVNVSSNIIGYSWQSAGAVGSGQSAGAANSWQDFKSEEPSPRYLFQEAGVYGLMLMVKNEFNCWDTVMKTIAVESDFAAYIPNAFTPNGDGLNDTFYPVLRGVKKFELQIYDRWGTLLFASQTADKIWDGTYKGEACKQDVYNYKLVLLNVKGEEKLYAGALMLYR